MKLKKINKKSLIILIFSILLLFSIYIIYKKLIIFNKIENFNPNITTPAKNTKSQLMKSGKLKTINISHGNENVSKAIENTLDKLIDNEVNLANQLKTFNIKVESHKTELGKAAGASISDGATNSISHLKPISDTIQKQVNNLSSDPPDHLDNHPNSPNFNPKKATSWWIPHGNTPSYYRGNYVTIGASTCNLPQCQPDGFTE